MTATRGHGADQELAQFFGELLQLVQTQVTQVCRRLDAVQQP
jgi:hypothetical protein